MHALAPYSVRCFAKEIEGKRDDKYYKLDMLPGGNDLLNLFHSYISVKTSFVLHEDTKQVFRFSDVDLDNKNRIITGWMHCGTYGNKRDIIDVKTGLVDYVKTKDNAEIVKYFFSFWIPKSKTEGIMMFHTIKSDGQKTFFMSVFDEYFKRYVANKNLLVRPLSHEKSIQHWLNGEAREIKVDKYTGNEDITDSLFSNDVATSSLIMTARKNKVLGSLKDFWKGGDKEAVVKMLSEFGHQVSVSVTLDGKTKTFSVGPNSKQSICQIELDSTVVVDDEGPVLSSFKPWAIDNIADLAKYM